MVTYMKPAPHERGKGDIIRLHSLGFSTVPGENSQLLGATLDVCGAQQVTILLCDRQSTQLGTHEVGHEDVLAKGRIPAHQATSLRVILVHPAVRKGLGHEWTGSEQTEPSLLTTGDCLLLC